MTITFWSNKENKQLGAWTGERRDGQFSKRQKMQIANLRIKILSAGQSDDVEVILVADEGVKDLNIEGVEWEAQ